MTEFFNTTVGLPYGWSWFLATIAGILLIALPLMLTVAMIIYADRKIWAAMALRRGPNVVGPFGLLQSFADGLKVFLQETIIPSAANRGLFLLAPIITFTVALIVWAVVPFDAGVVLADINVGLLYVLAASSLGVYGVIIAGWASNSKYPFYSALRAAAQMVSYEVAIGFILISVVLYAGSFNLSQIVLAQKGHIFGIINGFGLNPLFLPMAVMFFISSLAETQRAPFDLTEAESELVAGYQTEYSSMSFALYWLGEYANVILMCVLNATLFWGGWLPPIDWAPLYAVPGIIWLFLKMCLFFFFFSWVKATVPRYRYDQLMRLGWKVFLPVSLFWVFLVSGILMFDRVGVEGAGGRGITTAQLPESRRYDCTLNRNEAGNTFAQTVAVQLYQPSLWVGNTDVGHEDWRLRGGSSAAGAPFPHSLQDSLPDVGQVFEWHGQNGAKYSAVVEWGDVSGAGALLTIRSRQAGSDAVARSFVGYCAPTDVVVPTRTV